MVKPIGWQTLAGVRGTPACASQDPRALRKESVTCAASVSKHATRTWGGLDRQDVEPADDPPDLGWVGDLLRKLVAMDDDRARRGRHLLARCALVDPLDLRVRTDDGPGRERYRVTMSKRVGAELPAGGRSTIAPTSATRGAGFAPAPQAVRTRTRAPAGRSKRFIRRLYVAGPPTVTPGCRSCGSGNLAHMARVLYKPLGLIVSVLGGIVAGKVFKRVWGRVAHEEKAPKATDERKGWGEVITAATVQGAVFGGVKAAIDRAGATGFQYLTGAWPGRTKD